MRCWRAGAPARRLKRCSVRCAASSARRSGADWSRKTWQPAWSYEVGKRHKGKVEIPSKAEVKALLDAATGRERALLVTAVFTGMRASELRGLRWADCDFNQRGNPGSPAGGTSGHIGSAEVGQAAAAIFPWRRW